MARDSWRCSTCNGLMYNIGLEDGQVYPAPGAPPSHFISKQHPRVCTLCYELHQFEQALELKDKIDESHQSSGL